jgi:hypothetical protein
LWRGEFAPRGFTVAEIAEIARDRKTKTLPLINTDGTQRSGDPVIGNPKPLKPPPKTQKKAAPEGAAELNQFSGVNARSE